MGFRPQRQLVQLDFSQTEFAGLEITTRAVPVSTLLGFIELIDQAEALDAKAFKPEDLNVVRELFARFAAVLVSWNVEDDDGQPVPATVDGLTSQDFPFVMSVISTWITALSQAPPPLRSASKPGGPPLEASLPMETLPANPPS
jgi:hypothetical protein